MVATTKTKEKKPLSPNRAWLYVVLGGLLEIVWASGFKYEQIPQLVAVEAVMSGGISPTKVGVLLLLLLCILGLKLTSDRR